MARKSIDFSQSLLKFQAARRSGVSTTESASTDKAPISETSSNSTSTNSTNSTNPKLTPNPTIYSISTKPPNHNRAKLTSTVDLLNAFSPRSTASPEVEDIESLKTKYAIQNRSLAKSNSALTSKVSDLESRVSELINENMSLRKNRSAKDLESKKLLQESLDMIEDKVLLKFNEILQFLKIVRNIENLPENPNLDVLTDLSRPLTSTPLERETFISTPELDLTFLSRTNNVNSVNKTAETNLVRDTDMSPNLTANQTFAEQSVTDFGHNINNHNISTILEARELDISMEADPEKQSLMVESNLEIPKDTKQKKSNAPSRSRSKPKIDTLRGNERKNEHSLIVEDQRSREISKIDIPRDNEEKHENLLNGEEPRRSSRSKKAVNYTPLPISAKMRRESVKMMDAVGENVLINYVVPKIKKEDETKERKRKILSTKTPEPDVKTKRRPLANITNVSRQLARSDKEKIVKSNEIAESDLSVFDFEDDKPRPTNVYGRRTVRGRRHTLLM